MRRALRYGPRRTARNTDGRSGLTQAVGWVYLRPRSAARFPTSVPLPAGPPGGGKSYRRAFRHTSPVVVSDAGFRNRRRTVHQPDAERAVVALPQQVGAAVAASKQMPERSGIRQTSQPILVRLVS
jgi:hypothetical protein